MKARIVFGAIFLLGLSLLARGLMAAETNIYWRVDLNQGTSVIAYGQGATEELAWTDCRRLRALTRAMTAAETRKAAVAAVSSSAVRWCKNPMQYATVTPDPMAPPPVNCVVSDWSAWSDPVWSTCAGGQQTRTLEHTRTVVTQAANGGTVCPELRETRSEVRICVSGRTASVSWTPPDRNTDGTALADLAGVRIHYGQSATALAYVVNVPAGARNVTVTLPAVGTWYFGGRAYRAIGPDSDLSNIVTRVAT